MGLSVKRAAIILCGLLAGIAAGCGSVAPELSTTERDVYEAFLAARRGDPGFVVYLAAATEAEWFEENPFKAQEWAGYLDGLGGIPIELVEELYRVNRHPAPIGGSLLPADIVILPPDYPPPDGFLVDTHCSPNELRPESETWSPDECDVRPYHTLSRVAISRDGTLALMKYLYTCVPLCGSEGFVAFRRDGGRWRRFGKRVLWIS